MILVPSHLIPAPREASAIHCTSNAARAGVAGSNKAYPNILHRCPCSASGCTGRGRTEEPPLRRCYLQPAQPRRQSDVWIL